MIRPRPAQSGDDPSTISRQRPSVGPRFSRVPPDSGIRAKHRPWRPLPAWRRRRHLNRGLGRAVIPGESPADTRRISSFRSCRAVDAPDTSASGRTVRGRCHHDGQVCGTRTRSEQSRRKAALVASVEDLLGEARRLDLASTEGRFRLGELAEALDRELSTVADLPTGWRSTWRSTGTSSPRPGSWPVRFRRLPGAPACPGPPM
jgi:hypothetical protein